MPSINGTEYLVILVVALLVFGPERLPGLARKVAGWMREIRTVANDFRVALEAEVGDLKAPLEELTQPLREVQDAAGGIAKEAAETLTWKGPVHDQGPTPADAAEDLAGIEQAGNQGAHTGEDPGDQPTDDSQIP